MELPPLYNATIHRRYKRFLADVTLADGRQVVAHCPNTGSMQSCWQPGAPVQVSHSDNPKRKLAWTLERVDMGSGWVGVHTGRVNAVIAEGISNNQIPALANYRQVIREPQFNIRGHPNSRFDCLLIHEHNIDCYVEVKNATLLVNNTIQFPDAVTERGRKHLELLAIAVNRGFRGVILFAVNRPEGHSFEAAAEIDPDYAKTLEIVVRKGVEVVVVRFKHTENSIEIAGSTCFDRSQL
jgi:sugar fermentation stimulation protein A